MALLHGWRANCDVKILLYESDPQNPDPKDIATVTNYIVSYASKGQETLEEEKSSMRALILAAEEVTGCQDELFSLARKLLNRYLGEKLISKQECMVQLAGLELWICSEHFQRISLSGYTRLDNTGTKGTNRFLKLYNERPLEVRSTYRPFAESAKGRDRTIFSNVT